MMMSQAMLLEHGSLELRKAGGGRWVCSAGSGACPVKETQSYVAGRATRG